MYFFTVLFLASSKCNLFLFCLSSCDGEHPAGDDERSLQADPADRGPHRALQRPGPQLPESHPRRQHQLRGVRAPEDTAGSEVTLKLDLSLLLQSDSPTTATTTVPPLSC